MSDTSEVNYDHFVAKFDAEEGYYWYLWPFFERLWKSTKQMIDLYGDADFDSQNLDSLRGILIEAKDSLKDKPDILEVNYGTQDNKKVYYSISKRNLEEQIDLLINSADIAKNEGKHLIFRGD